MEPTKEYLIQKHINEGLSARSIAKELGCSHTKIIKRMKKYAIENTTDLSYNQHGRKYNYNDNYFSNIDTPDKAYWLGFIWADGYIYTSNKQRKLRIALSIKDENHLQKFKQCINGEMDIKYDLINSFGSTRRCCYIDVSSSRLCDDLINHGVTNNKESRTKLPNISEELMFHFLRGLIDADGTIQINRTTNKNKVYEVLTVNFVGNKDLLEEIRLYLQKFDIAFTDRSLIRLKGIYRLGLYKREYVLKLLKMIYPSDDCVLMNRKRDIYNSFLCKI